MNRTLIAIASWILATFGAGIAVIGFVVVEPFTLTGAILSVGGGMVGAVSMGSLALLARDSPRYRKEDA